MDGKQYLISFIATMQGNRLVISNMKQLEGQVTRTGVATKTGTRHTSDFIRALRRVAIVVPVWFAFRQTMMLVIQSIQSATQHYVEFEDVLAKAAAVTSNANMDIVQAMEIVRREAEDFARTHRGTAKDVGEAYYRMATSGLDFKDSIEGAIPAVKLAIGTYGDITATAKTVSAMYRLLGDNIEGATTRQEKMTRIVDVLGRAWQNHEVELNEVSQAIANVGGQAKAFGITMTELVAILSVSSDALLKGGRAGRLFGRTLDEMARKLPAVEKFLGEAFDPTKPLNWFQILLKIVGKLSAMGRTTAQIEQALASMFGIRSTRFVRAIIVQYDKLNETLADLGDNSDGAVEALIRLRDNTPSTQIENLRENIAILGKDFLTGVMNADDFVDALKKVNDNLSSMSYNAMMAGTAVSGLLKNVRALWRIVAGEHQKPTFAGALLTGVLPPANVIINALQAIEDIDKLGAVDIEKEMLAAADKYFKIEQDRAKNRADAKRKEAEDLKNQLENQLNEEEGLVDLQNKKAEALYKVLDLQKDITDEIKNQYQLSNQSIQIWKIAQRFGTASARTILEAAEGKRTFESLSRRNQAIMRQYLSGQAEQAQAKRFFFGTERFRGAGEAIPIPERKEIEERRLQLQERLVRLAPDIPIELRQEIKVHLDSEEIDRKVREALVKQLERQDYSDLVRKINKRIEEY